MLAKKKQGKDSPKPEATSRTGQQTAADAAVKTDKSEAKSNLPWILVAVLCSAVLALSFLLHEARPNNSADLLTLIEQLQLRNQTLTAQVTQLETDNTSYANAVQDKIKEISGLQVKLTQLEVDNTSHANAVQVKINENKGLQEKLDASVVSLAQRDKTIGEQGRKITQLDFANEQKNITIGQLKKAKSELVDKVTQLQEQLEQKQTDHDSLVKQFEQEKEKNKSAAEKAKSL